MMVALRLAGMKQIAIENACKIGWFHGMKLMSCEDQIIVGPGSLFHVASHDHRASPRNLPSIVLKVLRKVP